MAAFDLKNIRSVSDNGDHFVVHHADHGVFPVAKRGLSENTLTRIQALADGKPTGPEAEYLKRAKDVEQKLARGGTVKDRPWYQFGFEPGEGFSSTDAPPSDTGSSEDPTETPAAFSSISPGMTMPGVSVGLPPAMTARVPAPVPVSDAPAPLKDPDYARVQEIAKGEAAPETPPSTEEAKPAEAAPAAAPASATPPPAIRQGAAKAGPSVDDDLNNAAKMEMDAQNRAAAIEQKKQAEMAALQQASQTRQQEIWEKSQAQLKENLDRQNRLMDDIANSKIDPDRFWNSRDLGQKVSATIGMILGGIGQGMVGGDNPALSVIEKAIERDVEAQKADLGKKNNLVSLYMQQGHDIQNAAQLAITHEMAAVEGQMKAAGFRYASAATVPNLQAAIAQSEMNRQKMVMDVHERQLNNAIKAEQLKHDRLVNAMSQGQMALAPYLEQVRTALASGQGVPAQSAEGVLATKMGKEIPQVVVNGKIYQAKTAQDAEKFSDQQATIQKVKNAAIAFDAFRKEHPGGLTALGDREIIAQGQSLQRELADSLNELSGKVNDKERKSIEQIIPDPGAFFSSDARMAGTASAAVDRVNRALEAEMMARLVAGGGRTRAPAPARGGE